MKMTLNISLPPEKIQAINLFLESRNKCSTQFYNLLKTA